MIPSLYGVIVMLVGVILIHYALKLIEAQLGQIVVTPTPYTTPPRADQPIGGVT